MKDSVEQLGAMSVLQGRATIKRKDVKTLFVMMEEIQKQNEQIITMLREQKSDSKKAVKEKDE